MLERQREGIAKAKAEGKYKGVPRPHDARLLTLCASREGLAGDAIAAPLGIGRASVFRILRSVLLDDEALSYCASEPRISPIFKQTTLRLEEVAALVRSRQRSATLATRRASATWADAEEFANHLEGEHFNPRKDRGKGKDRGVWRRSGESAR